MHKTCSRASAPVLWPPLDQVTDGDFTGVIAMVRAALSEGFCPAGHLLAHGGGKWGTCARCGWGWTVTVPGFRCQPLGRCAGYWCVDSSRRYWQEEFRMLPAV